METRKNYEKVKLFCGILYRDEDVMSAAREKLIRRLGETDLEAGPFPFDFTSYYRGEMGDGLKRRFLSFKERISVENSYVWKVFTNEVEKEFYGGKEFPRRINLDPGYLNLSRVILFSAKDYSHRIYLGRGIFGEVTLYFEKNRFMFLPWTYPDYKTEKYLDFFMKARNIYREQLKDEDAAQDSH